MCSKKSVSMGANYFGVNTLEQRYTGRTYAAQGIKNNSYLKFGQTQLDKDAFEYSSDSIGQFLNINYLTQAVKTNPEIKRILRENAMSDKLNMQDLSDILANHATQTQAIALGIVEHLPVSLKYQIDTNILKQAAYLHDIGKVLIPDEILNKPAKLTPEEQKIMHTHSELGYELLKDSNLNPKTLELIKYHHQNALKNGYPAVNENFNADINLQILSAADKFSALTEKRPYKEAMSDTKALAVIYKDVKDGKIHPFVFKALVATVQEKSANKIAA